MASRAFLIVAVVAAVMTAPTMAADHMVDWKLDTNYTEWAAKETFLVGDTLTFMYNPANHTVLSVTGTNFKDCNRTNPLKGPFKTGNDVFHLDVPGKKWYICGVGEHCAKRQMHLVIQVDAVAPAPTPIPGSSASKVAKSSMWMLAVAAAYRMIVA